MKTLVRFIRTMFKLQGSGTRGWRGDDEEDGVGVLVPSGPRLLRGGAHAKPPNFERR